MRRVGHDVLISVAIGLVLLAYAAVLVGYLPMGISRLVISLGFVGVLGVIAGATMNCSIGAKLGLILMVPGIHFLYDGIDHAKAALSAIWYVTEIALLWIGILVTNLIHMKRHGTSAPAA